MHSRGWNNEHVCGDGNLNDMDLDIKMLSYLDCFYCLFLSVYGKEVLRN